MAAAASAAGAVVRKAPGRSPAVEIERAGKSVTLPIVSDERDWRETTVEEALYAVIEDARGWTAGRFDEDAERTLTRIRTTDVEAFRREHEKQLARVRQLADVLGGEDRLAALYAVADLA